MLKEYVDRDSSNVAPVYVISSGPQKQSEMNCEEVECEKMNFHKTDPTCSKLQNSDILKDLYKNLSHLDQTQRDELEMLILEHEHLFLIFQQELIKSIMMLTLRVQNQLNSIHIE